MARKLTKTQEKLLATARAHSGRVAVESYSGRGGGGGLIRGGRREFSAAMALRDAGLLVVVNRSSSVVYSNGYGCTVISCLLKLAEG